MYLCYSVTVIHRCKLYNHTARTVKRLVDLCNNPASAALGVPYIYAMKAQGGVEIWLHSFITLAEDGGEWR